MKLVLYGIWVTHGIEMLKVIWEWCTKECDEMGNKLLIVASERYGDFVKEIAESMKCFERISFCR